MTTEPQRRDPATQESNPLGSGPWFLFAFFVRALAILFGVFCVLGLLFIGKLTAAMVAGFLGAVAACIRVPRRDGPRSRAIAIGVLAVGAMGLQGVDVVIYYRYLDIAGNYYPWAITIFAWLLFAALALIAWRGWKQ